MAAAPVLFRADLPPAQRFMLASLNAGPIELFTFATAPARVLAWAVIEDPGAAPIIVDGYGVLPVVRVAPGIYWITPDPDVVPVPPAAFTAIGSQYRVESPPLVTPTAGIMIPSVFSTEPPAGTFELARLEIISNLIQDGPFNVWFIGA
jgi:hypothetical protein